MLSGRCCLANTHHSRLCSVYSAAWLFLQCTPIGAMRPTCVTPCQVGASHLFFLLRSALPPAPASHHYPPCPILTSGVSAGLGASSSSFWLRLWMEQSRSPRCTTLPYLSARTCAHTRARAVTCHTLGNTVWHNMQTLETRQQAA